jgi:phosphonate transport system substrate-binding protein
MKRSSLSLARGLALALALTAPPASAADWRDEIKVFRVGVLAASGSSYRISALEPFRAYLESKLGVHVELVPAGNYAALIDAEASARVQYAIHSAASYATAAATCGCVEPIAAPTAADGARGFYSVLIAPADSPIHSLADARGARLAVAGADSVAGRLVPMNAFAREGIVPSEYFSKIVETADPEAALDALLSGEADLAVGWSSLTGDVSAGYDFGVLSGMVADGRLSMDAIRVVWQSPLIPFGPHVVRSDLPADLKSLLLSALLSMAAEAPAALDAVDRLGEGGGGFVAADAGLYAAISDLVAESTADKH